MKLNTCPGRTLMESDGAFVGRINDRSSYERINKWRRSSSSLAARNTRKASHLYSVPLTVSQRGACALNHSFSFFLREKFSLQSYVSHQSSKDLNESSLMRVRTSACRRIVPRFPLNTKMRIYLFHALLDMQICSFTNDEWKLERAKAFRHR